MGIPESLGPRLDTLRQPEHVDGLETIVPRNSDAVFVLSGEVVLDLDVIPISEGNRRWPRQIVNPHAKRYAEHTSEDYVLALYVPRGSTVLLTNSYDDTQNIIVRSKKFDSLALKERSFIGQLEIISGPEVFVHADRIGAPHYYVPESLMEFTVYDQKTERHDMPYGIIGEVAFCTPDTQSTIGNLLAQCQSDPYFDWDILVE